MGPDRLRRRSGGGADLAVAVSPCRARELATPAPGHRTALAFGLPIVIAGAIGWISLNGIRVVVEHAAGATALGLVAVGWELGQRFTGVDATLVSAASFPLAVRSFASGSRAEAFRQLAQGGLLLIALVVPARASLCLLTRPFVELTVSHSFQEATMLILPLAAISIGLHLGGLAGAVRAVSSPPVIGAALCFGYIRWKFDFPLPWGNTARVIIARDDGCRVAASTVG
jgi:hypothetical protein